MNMRLEPDKISVEMSRDDFDTLLVIIGYATAAAMDRDRAAAYLFLQFANDLNRDNPQYTPYRIPPEFQR
jgi:hypothetical protein